MNMPLSPDWSDISVRLALTLIAGAVIGFNRGARGHAAGLRTTMLVCLAASVAMIQMNILLPVSGKTPESFSVMDVMRLPLGILTGVGFIGGGTILHKGDLVTGVTTAATLWLVTVIGLCLGGGQLVLGVAATVLGVITLWGLKWVDLAIPREHRATLVLNGEDDWKALIELPRLIKPLHCHAHFLSRKQVNEPGHAEYTFELRWKRPERAVPPMELVQRVAERYAIKSFELTSQNDRD
jgi:putative Mg2+ transporter-C (MgtC) family protein